MHFAKRRRCDLRSSGRRQLMLKEHKDEPKYHIEDIEKLADNDSHRMIIDLLGNSSPVLDVGCSTGFIGRYLMTRGVGAVGVELDPISAEKARPFYSKVLTGDITMPALLGQLEDAFFGAIILGDIIEHLPDPWDFMKCVTEKA